jgi:hypothetical protein
MMKRNRSKVKCKFCLILTNNYSFSSASPKIDDPQIDRETLHTPTDLSDNETVDNEPTADSQSIHSIEQAIQQQAIEDEVASTSSSFRSASESSVDDRRHTLGTSNAEYSLVAKQANQRTDVWNRVSVYVVRSFDSFNF